MTALRVLLVEDDPDDAELVLYELEQAGYACTSQRVDKPAAFREALATGRWDLILSDFTMPRFSARAALEILKESGLETPFIILSGTIGESTAVAAMKAGAHDFFAKHNLTRLGAAIERELAEAELRRDRRRALAELRRAEERHRLVVENIHDYAIFMLDPQGRVATWNRGAERLLRHDGDGILGQPLRTFFPADEHDTGLIDQALAEATATGAHQGEGWRVRGDGTRFWAECNLDRIVDEEQGLLGFSCVIHDVSARKALLDELRQAVEARDEFLSVASHELKTPLTSMRLVLEGLRRLERAHPATALGEEKVATRLARLERQTERLALLVERLLDVSRVSAGSLELHPEPMDLSETVARVVARLRDDADHAGCTVHLDAPASLAGHWDPLRLDIVVSNLLANAIKYGAGKPIELSVARDRDGHARLVVRDHGIGIAPEAQAHIFERFGRAVSENHYGGFGIGLWLVRQVVEAHGGTIEVESRPGEGATFTVVLGGAPHRP